MKQTIYNVTLKILIYVQVCMDSFKTLLGLIWLKHDDYNRQTQGEIIKHHPIPLFSKALLWKRQRQLDMRV